MKKMITSSVLLSTTLAAAPAFAHVGEHSHATPTHFLVEHGLAIGAVAFVVLAGVAYILRKKA